ncbi:MAG: DNA polymerase III subunit delta [Spirochaetaceae bacterium]|nr:DNA polymerase III subunit delta [Spirochaetaceae bacterium]MCF7949665.1 DNA polymerase III subunit delta [Spirochaetia bacterium]MCF7952322.1 DNA polymerase III subunit delta [Spirochaetaceae bacterium]
MAHPAPVYLLVGPEEGEKQEFIRNLQQSYEKGAGEKPETHRFYSGQTDMGEVVSLLKNGSLFSSYKFVTILQVEQLKKADLQLLSDYIKSSESSATLFLLSHDYRAPAQLTKAVPKSQQKTFFELFEDKKREWLLRYFRRAELSVDEDAIEMVLELVENNTLEMKNAADKLILYFGKGSVLSADDIEEFIYHSKEENVFTLFQKITYKDFPGALEVLHKIMLSGQNNGVQLLGGLLWQFRRLLKLSRMLDRRYSPDEAFRQIPLRGKRNQKNYMTARSHFPTESIEAAIALIAEYDGRVRQQRGEAEKLVLEFFLYRLLLPPCCT